MTALAVWDCGPHTGGSSMGVRGRLELSRARRGHGFSQKTKTSWGHLLPIRGMSPGYGTQALLGRSGISW